MLDSVGLRVFSLRHAAPQIRSRSYSIEVLCFSATVMIAREAKIDTERF